MAEKNQNGQFIAIFTFYVTNLLCGRDNFNRFSCIRIKLVMHVANNQFSDKFNNQNSRFIVIFRILRQ